MRSDIKKDFPIFEKHPTLSYLDSAASAQIPQAVIDATTAFDTGCRANIHRGTYELSERATDLYEAARATIATFIDAEPDEIIFTSGTTDSMNKLAYMLEQSPYVWKKGGVVSTIMEHHSSLLPFRELAKRNGVPFSIIPLDLNYDLDLSALETYISDGTGLVVVTLASNVLGTVNDVRRIVERAHEVGACVVVDAAQAVGHLPVSVKELDCDFLAFSGHKMCGPMGTGVLYGKKELLEKLYPGAFGGGMVGDVDTLTAVFVDSPYRFEAGTQNVGGAIGLAAAVSYLTAVGVEHVASHTQEMVSYAIKTLDAIPGVTLYTQRDTKRNAGIVSFSLEGIHPHDIAEVCSRENVAVRAGHHCALPLMKHLGVPGTVRASFYLYSTKEDVDRLAAAIRKVQSIFA